MKKSFYSAAIFLLLPVCIFAGKTSLLQVRDIWTLRPVAGAAAITAGDTLYSDHNGFFHFQKPLDQLAGLKIFKKGFFPEVLSQQNLTVEIIYLVPVMSTDEITVLRSREAAQPLSLPSNISRLDVREALAGGLQTVDEILSGQEGLFIKSYGGSGQLQTISLRGMAAGQTQVLLDGLPLNNLQLGSADLGEYDLSDLSAVAVYRGSNSLLGGSAGAINLLPDTIHSKPYYSAHIQQASFKNESYRVRLDLPLKGVLNSVSVRRSLAQNRYSARDAQGRYVHLQNRDFSRWQCTLRSRFNPAPDWTLQSWFSSFKHSGGAPKPFVNAASEQSNAARKHQDVTLSKMKLLHSFGNGRLLLQAFVRNEWMEYQDPDYVTNELPLYSRHFNQQLGLQSAVTYLPFENLLIQSGGQWYRERVRSSAAGSHQRQYGALFLNSDHQFFSSKQGWLRAAHFNVQLRLEYFSPSQTILLPAAALNFNTVGGRVYGSLGKNYRQPTFNDLYWQPGGNPRLRPEKSFHAEAGYEHTRQLGSFVWRFNADLYANLVSDQIKWLPGSDYWTPQNIAGVYSRGLEWRLTVSDIKDVSRLTVNYTYGRAEKNKAEFMGDPTVGNQLPFVPREQISIQTRSAWRNVRFGLRLTHASFRYLTLQNDARQILPAYTTGGLWLGVAKTWLGQHWNLGCSIHNLFDLRYQVVAGYPMPPRSFLLSIALNSQ